MNGGQLALAATLGIYVQGICGAGTPRIDFERTSYDFGRTTGVHTVAAKINFTNIGDATLKLDKLSTSCGCTEATAEPDTLEPGQAGAISFTVTMTSRRSLIKSHIVVPSNDPINPEADLGVSVDYVPLFEVEPMMVKLDLRPGEASKSAVTVRRTDGKPLGITKLEPSKPWLKAALEPGSQPQATEAHILLEAKPDGSPRYYTEVVRLFADRQEEPAATAVLMGHIGGDVRLSPETLVWNLKNLRDIPTPEREGPLSRRVNISSAGPSLSLRNPSSTLPGLKVELLPGQGTNGYQLVATFEKAPRSNLRGTINFETNLPKEPVVQVPVLVGVEEE